ncbi:DnaB-like helicase C-terminal domain-containing protein [Proteinivorax hydrogeniformans]|uniref:DNA 5'-3' helicase n=1 Tax=Proteinivorax hydrogeniformans TaxID=1826727 RepID=A0AAU8HWW0_9FIRM
MDIESAINAVKEKVNIIDFIGEYTDLQRKGNLHQGKCVLHDDKDTPSLTVYEETQSFYCFGCKAGGSVIEFVKDYYNYDFNEAMQFLSERAGIEVKSVDPAKYRKKKARVQQNQSQVQNTKQQLIQTENTGKSYLQGRGFSVETIEDFELGYSNSDNSIVIPIHDGFGKVVGFSKRFLDEGVEPKYKNSRNDDVFNKAELLYNLHNARKNIDDSLYVVEGYFDVISLWQSGIKAVVGVMKDSMTTEQAQIISRLCKKGKTVVLVPDNDSTGLKSVEKNKKTLYQVDSKLDIRVASLPPEHKDANDVLMEEGEQSLREILAEHKSADYIILKQLLNDQSSAEKEYITAKDYIQNNVYDVMVLENLINYLETRWDKPKVQIMEHLGLSKELPNDLLAEQKVLGILLEYPEKLDEVADTLKPEFFYDKTNLLLFQKVYDQYQSTGEVTKFNLYLDIMKDDSLQNGEELYKKLTDNIPPVEELGKAVDALASLHSKRNLIKAAEEIETIVSTNEKESVDSLQSMAQEVIFQATDMGGSNKSIFNTNELLANRLEEYVKRKEGMAPRGLMTGYMSLDDLTNGFKNKHLIILAAATSTGKTAFSLNLVRNVLKRNLPVAFVSLEMSAEEVMDRLIIQELRIDSQKYEQGDLSDDQFAEFTEKLNLLYDLPLRVSDQRGINVSQIRARLRRMKAQMGGLGLVVIDYLQTISIPENGTTTTSRAVGDIVLQLRNLASELDVPIILLSQINRNYSQRQDKRPQVSDLRESGNIEEFADMIVFLYRHARVSVEAMEEAKAEGKENDTEVIVAKNRTGKTGVATLVFDDRYLRFVDPAGESLEKNMPN